MKECCSPKIWIKFFKAAADIHRQRILALIKKNKTINASQIVTKIGLSQPTISHHLSILKEANLISSYRKGKETYYSINQDLISSCCLGFIRKLA